MINFFTPFGRPNYRPYYHPPQTIPSNPQLSIQKSAETKLASPSHTNTSYEIKLLFEFRGIKLYTDDILILLLIFFLYKEKTDDKLLLIALFALLF